MSYDLRVAKDEYLFIGGGTNLTFSFVEGGSIDRYPLKYVQKYKKRSIDICFRDIGETITQEAVKESIEVYKRFDFSGGSKMFHIYGLEILSPDEVLERLIMSHKEISNG